MGKITIDEMHNSLFDYAQAVSDENLMTENKTIVDAINEIYGKRLIADSIGEPLNNTDTFTKMSDDINNLLSTFKTNIMNAGIAVESGDKFKTLIDKIKGLTEGEENKSIQFAQGNRKQISVSTLINEGISVDIDFEPTFLFLAISNRNTPSYTTSSYHGGIGTLGVIAICMPDLVETDSSRTIGLGNVGNGNSSSYYYDIVFNTGLTDGKITIERERVGPSWIYGDPAIDYDWLAIGVGEEDTTLRDSLASILQEEGVEITEEDDMASLITKVDEEFDKLNSSKNIVQIETTAGGANTFIVKNDGSLWVSGYNNYGELGLGHEETVRTLTQVTTNINNDVKEVSCGGVTAMLVKNDGTLWACGKNAYGSLAIPDVSETATFIQVPGIDNVKHILCGYYFALAIKNDGSLWGCGSNGQGQLGLGDTRGRSTFTQVTTNINYDVKDFYCTNTNNENTVFIVKNDGSVWACGYNNYGSLGTGGTDNKNVFTQII